MSLDFRSSFRNPFADPETDEDIQRRKAKHQQDAIIFVIAALLCAVFYDSGRKEGKEEAQRQTLREVSRIAEDHALLTEYLRERGH